MFKSIQGLARSDEDDTQVLDFSKRFLSRQFPANYNRDLRQLNCGDYDARIFELFVFEIPGKDRVFSGFYRGDGLPMIRAVLVGYQEE